MQWTFDSWLVRARTTKPERIDGETEDDAFGCHQIRIHGADAQEGRGCTRVPDR